MDGAPNLNIGVVVLVEDSFVSGLFSVVVAAGVPNENAGLASVDFDADPKVNSGFAASSTGLPKVNSGFAASSTGLPKVNSGFATSGLSSGLLKPNKGFGSSFLSDVEGNENAFCGFFVSSSLLLSSFFSPKVNGLDESVVGNLKTLSLIGLLN